MHLPLPVCFQSSDFSCFFFPISALKVMDSVSVLLNIFRPKCEQAAELRTFRILNCSLSYGKLESRFFFYVIQHVSDRKIENTYLPYLMFFQPLPEPHIFFLALKKRKLFTFPYCAGVSNNHCLLTFFHCRESLLDT